MTEAERMEWTGEAWRDHREQARKRAAAQLDLGERHARDLYTLGVQRSVARSAIAARQGVRAYRKPAPFAWFRTLLGM